MSNKVGRNQPCPCGSGKKYKFCCGMYTERQRKIVVKRECASCGGVSDIEVDLTKDLMNKFSTYTRPIKEFCKDQGMYHFGLITVGREIELNDLLKKGGLTKELIIDEYKKYTRDQVVGLLDLAIEESELFRKRTDVLHDSFNAHFDGKYTLSIPVLLAQIEGILREYGGLSLKDTFRPTIKTDIWDHKFAFPIKDDAEYFNRFIDNLYKGSQSDESFNRNPILHGMNIKYNSLEHSLLLILTVLEIRMFVYFENNLKDIVEKNA